MVSNNKSRQGFAQRGGLPTLDQPFRSFRRLRGGIGGLLDRYIAAKFRRQPMAERAEGLADQRSDGLRTEGSVRLGIVRVGIVTRQTEDQRRDAKGQRDFSGGGIFAFHKFHIGGRKAHRLPVEAALQQDRPARVARALVTGFELLFQAVELVGRERRAVGTVIDYRAGGSRGVVQQRLVPTARGIVDIDRDRGGLKRAKAVVIVEGVERLDVQDRRGAFGLREANGFVPDAVLVPRRPGDDAHTVGAQGVKLGRCAGC